MVAHARRSSPTPPSAPTPVSIPKLVTDPIWSVRIWPVSVEVGDGVYEIPALPAADWLAVLMNRQLTSDHIFPGMLPEAEQSDVEQVFHDGLRDGLMDSEEYFGLGWEVLSEVCGRPWWVALRMIMTAVDGWDAIGGELIRKVDASQVSISAWLDVLFQVIVQSLEESKRNMYLLKLEIPPDGWGDAPEEMEMSTDAFLAMAG